MEHLRIVANGNHMISKVNGELMAELIDDSPKALKDGVLALQIHQGATMTIQFKDMKIKLLTADRGQTNEGAREKLEDGRFREG